MVYLFHTITAQDWRRMLRAMAVLVLVWMVLGATSSYAQSCATNTVNIKLTPPPNIFFKTGSVPGTSTLANLVWTVEFKGCSGFSNTTITFGNLYPLQFRSGSFNTDSSTATALILKTSMAATCWLISCFDSSGTLIPTNPDNVDGIMFNAVMQVTGLNASNTNCISPTKKVAASNLVSFKQTTGQVVANSCISFKVEVNATIDQNNIVLPANVATILPNGAINGLKTGYGISTLPGSLISGNAADATTIIKTLLFPGSTFRVLTGTCSLTLPNSGVNFQPISLNQLKTASNGTVVSSQDFTLAINNCQGTSIGTKKALQWTFTTPKASDLTRMENAVANGATGMSAQIQADSKISPVDGSALPSVITSGETYIASGNTSNVQTLTYKANLIRNADTVTTGSFSSTAMVTLSYQ